MKKILVVFAVLLAIFLVGCPNAPSNNVPEEKASSLKASGATTVPTTEEEIIDVFASAEDMDSDPLVVDLKEFFDSFGNGSKAINRGKSTTTAKGIVKKAFSVAKDLEETLIPQISDIQAALEAFPNTKELDETINVSGEAIGTYLTFTKGEATLKANAKTTDNAAIAEDLSNLKEISGDASLKIEINPTNALYDIGSAIKDVKFKTNAAGDAKIVSTSEGNAELPKITLNYTESLSIGLSFSKNEKGGKFILTENAKHSGDIDASALEGDPSTVVNNLITEITISLKVYDDNNQVKFSKTYSSIDDFINAFWSEEEETE
ncbi:MAG TPA: hypothetical protein PLQ30_08245 [Rectinema sp.]|jgi:multidrug efflux pump subunit AcrB|nr:hypothetical protein [Rectinema sp.]